MPAKRFQYDSSFLRSLLAPRKPRHPLLRLALGIVGLGLLALLIFFSVFVGAAMILAGVAFKLLGQRGKPVAARDPNVVEGQFRVVRKPGLPISH